MLFHRGSASDPEMVVVKNDTTIVREPSFSGFFECSKQPEPPFSRSAPSLSATIIAVLIGVALLLTSAGAWMSAHRAERRSLAIEAEVIEMKASLESLAAALRVQGQLHTQHATALQAAHSNHVQGVESLRASHDRLTADLPAVLAAASPSADAIASRLATPFIELRQHIARLDERLEGTAARVEGAASAATTAAAAAAALRVQPSPPPAPAAPLRSVRASPPTALAAPVGALHPMTARGDGSVRVTFKFEAPSGAAAIVWLGRERADHKYDREVKYTELPHGMQVVETTRPGECWRARDARSGALLLDRFCATIAPAQHVLVHA